MLTTLITLTMTLGAFQDAPAVTEPTVAAPVPVAQTSEKVASYLKEAESQLYDPQAAGLKSLEFDLPVEVPQLGRIGQVHVTWIAGGQATIDATMSEDTQVPGMPPGAVEQMAQATGAEYLNAMLNRPISMLLDNGVATLVGAEDGLVRVDFDAPEARDAGIAGQSYLFDEDGVLRRSVTKMTMMGAKITAKQDYRWKPAGESTLLLPDSQSIAADMGFIVQKVDVSFTYQMIDGIVLPASIVKTTDIPAAAGGGTQRQVQAVENLIVNGKSAAAPESAPMGG
jgi:hypothetical protein